MSESNPKKTTEVPAPVKDIGSVSERRAKDKLVVLAAIVAVVIIVAGLLIWQPFNHGPSEQQIAKAENSGNYTLAIQLVEQAISHQHNKTKKAQLYSRLAGNYGNSGKTKQ